MSSTHPTTFYPLGTRCAGKSIAKGAIIDLGPNDGTVGGGQVTLAGGDKNTSDYVELAEGLISGLTDGTIETWATQHTVKNWSRIFDFGKGTNEDYIMMSWTRGTDINLDRAGIRIDNAEHCVDETMAPYTDARTGDAGPAGPRRPGAAAPPSLTDSTKVAFQGRGPRELAVFCACRQRFATGPVHSYT